MKSYLFLTVLFLLLTFFVELSCHPSTSNNNNFYAYAIKHELSNLKNAVVCAHPLASQAGVWVMEQGGNAFDAAIATQLALAVVFPAAGNIGGGGFMLAREKNGNTFMLDFREKAPLKSSEKMYLDAYGNVLPSKVEGILSSGVPGTIDGIFATIPYAKLSVEKLFEPAIALAKYGFSVSEKEAELLNHHQTLFTKYNPAFCVYIKPNGWKKGDTLVQKDLAETLTRIAKNGRKEFYEKGKTFDLIVAQSNRSHGIITQKDLQQYHSVNRKPIQFKYKDYTMIVPNLPSSGGILLAQMFLMIEPYTKMGLFREPSLSTTQIMVEAEKRAYYDRARYMGDPDFYKPNLKALLDSSYVRSKMKNFQLGGKPIPSSSLNFTTLLPKESDETTHISIVDKEGNAVSITTTLNGFYGSGVCVEGAGFLLNNEMDDFSAKPGASNIFGAVEGEINKIEPSKRMLSSMTPTIVLQANDLKYVLGSPGGTTIPTSVFQTLVNLIEYKLPPSDAVFNPRFHHQWIPDTVFTESTFATKYMDSLILLGYKVITKKKWGKVDLIVINQNKTITAVGDNRGDDSPDGQPN